MFNQDSFIISPETFKLIQELQQIPELKNFHLVGGTSLALQIGHRNSIDIDLYTNESFSCEKIIDSVSSVFKFEVSNFQKNMVMGFINQVKTDFVLHQYPYINNPIFEEGISYLSMQDISAMKINAISRSGKRLKDFIDIYYLLEHFSIAEMVGFFCEKYPNTNSLIAVKSLNCFDDIDETIDPPMLKSPLSFDKIKDRIKEALLNTDKIY
jgi:hypothetical protein